MCVTYPGLVREVDGSTALVEIEGRQRRASLVLVPEVAVGDWVVVSVGTVLQVLDPADAAELISLLDAAARDEVATSAP
jgi:hydrogenase expression/formation protein HypC